MHLIGSSPVSLRFLFIPLAASKTWGNAWTTPWSVTATALWPKDAASLTRSAGSVVASLSLILVWTWSSTLLRFALSFLLGGFSALKKPETLSILSPVKESFSTFPWMPIKPPLPYSFWKLSASSGFKNAIQDIPSVSSKHINLTTTLLPVFASLKLSSLNEISPATLTSKHPTVRFSIFMNVACFFTRPYNWFSAFSFAL